MLDMVEVVALDLIRKAHSLKQEEPTIADENNYGAQYNFTQEKPAKNYQSVEEDYERIDSPQPANHPKDKGGPFKISLLEMPLDPGSSPSKKQAGFESQDQIQPNNAKGSSSYRQQMQLINATNPNRSQHRHSQSNLDNSYLMSNQKS